MENFQFLVFKEFLNIITSYSPGPNAYWVLSRNVAQYVNLAKIL